MQKTGGSMVSVRSSTRLYMPRVLKAPPALPRLGKASARDEPRNSETSRQDARLYIFGASEAPPALRRGGADSRLQSVRPSPTHPPASSTEPALQGLQTRWRRQGDGHILPVACSSLIPNVTPAQGRGSHGRATERLYAPSRPKRPN